MSIKEISGHYALDPNHTRIGFSARHAMVTKVRGSFDAYEGNAHINGANPAETKISVEILASSFDTRNEGRDGHVKGEDFLDVEKYPTIKFVSTNVKAVDDTTIEVTGDLTIKDVTKKITIPFAFEGSATDPFGNNRIGFEGSTTIERSEFGLTWNAALETGGVLVSDKVNLEFEISAVKQA